MCVLLAVLVRHLRVNSYIHACVCYQPFWSDTSDLIIIYMPLMSVSLPNCVPSCHCQHLPSFASK